MKVFISWSGERSKKIANAIHQWLPMVLQYVDPFISDKDIAAGDRWAQTISLELEASNFGIICITPENVNSEWVLFESGALSKSMLDGKVVPLLFGLELSDLSGPLAQFQAQKLEESGISELVRSINKVAEKPATSNIIDMLVPSLWPKLNEVLANISKKAPSEKHKRAPHEVLEELVTSVRGLNNRLMESGADDVDRSRRFRGAGRRYYRVIQEIQFIFGENYKYPIYLKMTSGMIRSDYPWISEMLDVLYQSIVDGKRGLAKQTAYQIRDMVKIAISSPAFRDLLPDERDLGLIAEMIPDMALRAVNEARFLVGDREPRSQSEPAEKGIFE